MIRAFGQEETFMEKQVTLYKNQLLTEIAWEFISIWYGLRMELVQKFIKAFGLALCVLKKGQLDYDSVTLVLVLQYSAEMHWIGAFFDRFTIIQNQFRRAGNFLDLSRIPQEKYKSEASD